MYMQDRNISIKNNMKSASATATAKSTTSSTNGDKMSSLYKVEPPPEDPSIPKPTAEETTDFKQKVAEWVKLDDQVRKLNIAIRERRTHQKALSSGVQEFLIKFGYDNINSAQGTIKSSVRNVKQPLKLGDVRSKLDELFESDHTDLELDQLKEKIRDIFEAERPTTVKQSLSRSIPKVSMSIEL